MRSTFAPGLCLLWAAAFGLAADRARGAEPGMFVPVDTSALMGHPESHPMFGVENAFPKLRFQRPVDLTHPGDGTKRLFVVEQDGRIQVFAQHPAIENSKVFLDIAKKVRREHNEEGLLGLAFHPKFSENGQFFVFYSITPLGSRVSRFKVAADDPNRANLDSEEVLLEYPKPFGNHNGGSLQFGPDGFLYVSIGDGGLANDPQGNGQNLETLLGKILRIDVDRKDAGKNYAVPKDNPFVARGGKVRGEIWAYGLRNPWRIAFDRETGALWAADVGQDFVEEVDLITRGGNYGWNLREGKHPREPQSPRDSAEGFVEPLIEYPRVEGKSITGGRVYRGSRLPSLRGAYLYADFVSGNVWALHGNGKSTTVHHKIARTSHLISAFGEDEQGEVYFTAFDGGIYRLQASEPSAKNFPRTLTETGFFRSVKDHEPAAGLIPYEVNVPLWSDGADKLRFLALPKSETVVANEKEQWELPIGAVIVKTFLLKTDTRDPSKTRRLETRLFSHTPRGWEGTTYLWNEDQSEAHLLDDWPMRRDFEVKTPEGPVKQTWYFPSRSDCQACHTHNKGFVLGWNTRQLNRPDASGADRAANQLDRFRALHLFAPEGAPGDKPDAYPDWSDTQAPVEKRARAYLDANCSLCHGPGGFGMAGGSKANLNYYVPFEEAFAVPKSSAPDAKRWIVPGAPAQSMLIQRMESRDPKNQMPPLATHRTDKVALEVLRRWIEQQGKQEQH